MISPNFALRCVLRCHSSRAGLGRHPVRSGLCFSCSEAKSRSNPQILPFEGAIPRHLTRFITTKKEGGATEERELARTQRRDESDRRNERDSSANALDWQVMRVYARHPFSFCVWVVHSLGLAPMLCNACAEPSGGMGFPSTWMLVGTGWHSRVEWRVLWSSPVLRRRC
jgi:hypothetical protein